MQGRLEHKLKNEAKIEAILKDLPPLVTQFYYTRASSKESKGNLEYISKIRQFLKFINNDTKNVDITKITESDITSYLHSLENTVDSEGNIRETSFSYRKQIHSILNTFFEYLRKKRIIHDNPMDCIERPSASDVVNRVQLDISDINSLFKAVDKGAGTKHSINRQKAWKKRDIAIITLFAMTGMRKTALTEINLDDVDFINNTLTVIDKRHKTHVYKINHKLREVLLDWIEDRKDKIDNENIDALFISNRKTRIGDRTINAIVQKYSKSVFDKPISPHKLRAAFCTILYKQKGDIEFVRDAVGHSSVETTQRYIVKDNKAKEEASMIMDGIFK